MSAVLVGERQFITDAKLAEPPRISGDSEQVQRYRSIISIVLYGARHPRHGCEKWSLSIFHSADTVNRGVIRVADSQRSSLFILIDEIDLLPFNLLVRWLMMP